MTTSINMAWQDTSRSEVLTETGGIPEGRSEIGDVEVLVALSRAGDLLALQAKIDEIVYRTKLPGVSPHLEEGAQFYTLRRETAPLYVLGAEPGSWPFRITSREAVLPTSHWPMSIPPSRKGFVERCLRDLDADAEQEGIEIAPDVRAEAERILNEFKSLPDDIDVYANDGGRVTIEVPQGGFSLDCEPGGEAHCVVVVNGKARRAKYRDSTVLPDGFLKEGLRDVLR